jgi:hypothetical protein
MLIPPALGQLRRLARLNIAMPAAGFASTSVTRACSSLTAKFTSFFESEFIRQNQPSPERV